ncbi:MAG: hypothetical protein GEU81_13985, partial [Nitriliruptorales bacterium]|nr:hypothetical protein [Nitriliruptorales bacterium]
PIEELFEQTVTSVLRQATRDATILGHLSCRVENTAVALDHPAGFYHPQAAADCAVSASQRRANDTSFCTAHAPYTSTERLAIELETFISGDAFARSCPLVGTDVKVMIARAGREVDVTVCLPFRPERTGSLAEYRDALAHAEQVVREFAEPRIDGGRLSLSVNTKDQAGGVYLAPFGTSLGKGDCGLVGRGNKADGVIPAVRCTSMEALAGKNPLHHTGKLYTLAAMRIADRLHTQLSLSNETVLLSRNGCLLRTPAFVGVRLAAWACSADAPRPGSHA